MSEIGKQNDREARQELLNGPVTVRVSPHSYLSAILVGTFFSAFLFYIEYDVVGYALFGLSWIVLPTLALRDRISFDGRALLRTGVLPRLWARMYGSHTRLKLSHIEQVDSHAVRALKRGGNIHYRYRTILKGKGLNVTIASGGEDFRRMIQAVLPRLPENALDLRSVELRDHLKDPKEVLMRAEFVRLPSGEMASASIRSASRRRSIAPSATGEERAEDLQEVANELRILGHLGRALEAYRRALRLRRHDGRLIFEFARCLHSYSLIEKDRKLERRSLAALRLAERRLAENPDLLARLGEFYSSLGEYRRSGALYQRIVETVGDNFRALRGMAEMALTEGKIAHVIHNFAAAVRVAGTPALRRWAKSEAEYFSRLNSDDEYMELEISRVNLLDGLERSKRTALRISSVAFPAVLVGLLLEDQLITDIGWAVSTVALVVWTGLLLGARMFERRIPYELVDTEDS